MKRTDAKSTLNAAISRVDWKTILKYDGLIRLSQIVSFEERGESLDVSKFFIYKRDTIQRNR